jgi:hypothetical protein
MSSGASVRRSLASGSLHQGVGYVREVGARTGLVHWAGSGGWALAPRYQVAAPIPPPLSPSRAGRLMLLHPTSSQQQQQPDDVASVSH